ncbi:MAG: tetratricopeptide repeat protein [Acidobacteriota bacterium]
MLDSARRIVPAVTVAAVVILATFCEPALAQIRGRSTRGRPRVSGTVTDPDGNGLEGVLIRFVNQETSTKNTQAKTKKGKKAGVFVHPLVEFGKYKIYVEKEGYKVISYQIENRGSDESDAGSYGPVTFQLAQEPRIMTLLASGEAKLTVVMAPEADYERLALEAAQSGGSESGGAKVTRTRHPAEVARELFDRKDYRGALEKFLEAIALKDGARDPALHFAIAQTYFHLEDYTKASEFLDKTLALGGTPPKGANYFRALIAHKQGRTSDAITYLEKEIETTPNPPASMLVTLGTLYRDTGDRPRAIQTFERAVSADSKNLDALLSLGTLYAAEKDDQKAEQYFQQAAEAGASAGQDGATVFFNLGAVNYNKKDYRNAASAYERAIQIKPDFADAQRELGYTLWALENGAAGVDHVRMSLARAGDGARDRAEIEARIKVASR